MNDFKVSETAELIKAEQKLNVCSQRLAELKSILDVWAFTAQGEVSIKETGPILTLTFKKGDGTGYTRTLNRNELVYYAESESTLVEELTDQIFLRFYKEQIKNRLTKLVDQGIKNASLSEGKL